MVMYRVLREARGELSPAELGHSVEHPHMAVGVTEELRLATVVVHTACGLTDMQLEAELRAAEAELAHAARSLGPGSPAQR